MMTLSGDLDYLQAKLHGLRSRLYEGRRLAELCDLRSMAQLWHRLHPDADAGDHHALQRRLLADHVRTLDLIRRHLPERLAGLPTWALRRFQLENLKVLLRARRNGQSLEQVRPFLAPLPEDLELPAAALLGASSLADFLLVVPVPEFRKAGEKAAAHHAETGETFLLELAMEAAYTQGLLDAQGRLPGRHRRATEGLVRLEAGAATLLALFRLKLNYRLPFRTAQRVIVPAVAHPFQLERLYEYPAFEDMLRRVPRRLLPEEARAGVETIADLERAVWGRLLQVANRQFYRSVDDLGAVAAFFVIKRVELANLIRVVEGARHGLGPAAVRQGLIG